MKQSLTQTFNMDNYNTPLILSVLKAEMKNYKLITGMEDAGALIEDFYTNLDQVIMDLMMIDEEERERFYKVYDSYMEQLEEMSTIDFCERLNELAWELYIDLLSEKKLQNKLKNLEQK